MKKFCQNNFLFLLSFFCAFSILGLLIFFIPKAELHLMLNSFHTPFLDVFFKYYTQIGEIAPFLMVFILLFYRIGSALFLLCSELLSSIIVQIIKHIFNFPRPKIFFDLANNPDVLPIVDGVNLHSWHSFPSGHTASFCALFFTLNIIINSTPWQLKKSTLEIFHGLCFLLAIIGGYSRIYLSQHFANDVFVGGIIGVAATCLSFPFFKNLFFKKPFFYNYRICFKKNKC